MDEFAKIDVESIGGREIWMFEWIESSSPLLWLSMALYLVIQLS